MQDAKYNSIGKGYDVTRRADPEITSIFNSLLQAENGRRYLDVACGTRNYTIALSNICGNWTAVDISTTMLAEARSKSDKVIWLNSNIENLEFEPDYFDGAICSLAIHHFQNLDAAFKETGRVLKPSANFVIFTATPEQVRGYWLTHYFPEMMEKASTQMPSMEEMERALNGAGLHITTKQPFDITPELQDFFLYSGKQRPEIYLSEAVQNGISSFHDFCTDDELETGLSRLKQDIDSGKVWEIIDDCESEIGDYLFISTIKRIH